MIYLLSLIEMLLLEPSKAICYESFTDTILWQRQKTDSLYLEQISAEAYLPQVRFSTFTKLAGRMSYSTKLIRSDNNLKCINSNNKNVILSFILFSLLVSVIKLFCGVKAVLKHGIAQLSLLNCINTILCSPSFLMPSHTKADLEYIKFYELLET